MRTSKLLETPTLTKTLQNWCNTIVISWTYDWRLLSVLYQKVFNDVHLSSETFRKLCKCYRYRIKDHQRKRLHISFRRNTGSNVFIEIVASFRIKIIYSRVSRKRILMMMRLIFMFRLFLGKIKLNHFKIMVSHKVFGIYICVYFFRSKTHGVVHFNSCIKYIYWKTFSRKSRFIFYD